jgi:hypothetical protein
MVAQRVALARQILSAITVVGTVIGFSLVGAFERDERSAAHRVASAATPASILEARRFMP